MISTSPSIGQSDVTLARHWADLYRIRGFNPLPSRTDAKRPLVRFAEYWDTPAPASLFARHPTTNLQVMTGRRWRLLVIDLDGPEARERWGRMGLCPRTWATHSGGDGLHLWFRLPEGYPVELPKALLWGEWDPSAREGRGGWVKRRAIERLCDRSLIVAPPSIHPGTGRRYRFASQAESPVRMPMPADCPGWILRLPAMEAPVRETVPDLQPIGRTARSFPHGRYRSGDVLDAIHDKVSLAMSWGLRITGRPAGRGAIECRAIDREDAHASAIFVEATGRYWDPWLPDGRAISLFELGHRLGVYASWLDAVNDLARAYGVREVA